MLKVLDGLSNTAVYGDDIIIYNTNAMEHAADLGAVLKRIKEAGLKINGPKAQIAKQSVTLLGHKVGNGRIEPLQEKLLTIKSFPMPKSKRELRRFLGRAGFYSRFVKNFNEVASPLFDLLKKDTKFDWPEQAIQAFHKIQQLVTGEQLTLKIPALNQDFIVATDASDVAIGAVLKQGHEVVEYASRVLTSAERNYSTTEKECLAIVWALDKWRPYLLGRRFHVETDHRPLQWIKSAKDPRGKLARWALKLQEYDFTIRHVPGSENHLPDILSRTPDTKDLPDVAFGAHAMEIEGDITALQQAQRADAVLSRVIDAVLSGERPQESSELPGMKVFTARWKDLWVSSAGILMIRVDDRKSVPVIPSSQRKMLVTEAHKLAHTGCTRTYEMIKQRAYWPRMKKDVTDLVLGCTQCQLMKSKTLGNQYPSKPIPVREIGELWSMDIMGPFPMTTNGNQFIVIMTEHFTRWIEGAAVSDQRASTVSKVVMEYIVGRHGIPQKLLTDQGPCFESEEFRNCLERMGIKKVRTTPYHPQSNGLTERNNRTIKEWLATKGGNWEEELPLILLAHRASPQAATGKSPFELMYGRVARLPVDVQIGPWNAHRLDEITLDETRAIANDNLTNTQDRRSRMTSRRLRGKWRAFSPGTKVKYRENRSFGATGPGSRKFLARWRGPYEVVERRGPVYLIKNSSHTHRVHGSQLARWFDYCETTTKPPEQPQATTRRSSRSTRKPERLLLHVDPVLPGEECGERPEN